MPVPPGWFADAEEAFRTYDPFAWAKTFESFTLTEQATSWSEFLAWLDELPDAWCFRGQREASWVLDTSLDRAVRVEYRTENSSGLYHLDRETEISDLLFRFQQQAHRFIGHLPADNDLCSWFALMQHHGVPTRLLDWTMSPYVAAYFALEEQPQEHLSAVWAVNLNWLETRADEMLREGGPVATDYTSRADYMNSVLRETDKPIIVRVDPPRIDGRMVAQQGLFLCKLFHQTSFSVILMGMMKDPKTPRRLMLKPDRPDQPVVRKLEIDKALRIEFLENLRQMNIHRASLFPTLDGFGQSLRLDLEIKVKRSTM